LTTQERINRFISYFRGQQTAIQVLRFSEEFERARDPESGNLRFYKKVLLITALDTLAGIQYPKANYPQLNRRNQERVVSFVSESGIWPDGSLVSIPFLSKQSAVTGKRLSEVVHQRLSKRHNNQDFSVACREIDLPIEELLKLASTEQEEKAIRDHQHFALLYRYRNYLVHESREPGYAMEIGTDEAPYYHSYINDNRLYLCYPLAHFGTLLNNAIAYVEAFLTQHELDPYEFVSDTSSW
jgi:hypothetical protein